MESGSQQTLSTAIYLELINIFQVNGLAHFSPTHKSPHNRIAHREKQTQTVLMPLHQKI